MNIICFGQQNWDFCWTAKQQLMTRLVRRGHRVLYVDPDDIEPDGGEEPPAPLSRSVRKAEGGVLVFSHRHRPLLRWRVNRALRPRALRTEAERLGFVGGVAIALHQDAAEEMPLVSPAASVYYAVDEMSAFGGLPETGRAAIRMQEERVVRSVDVALAVSPRLVRRFSTLSDAAYLLVNAADVSHFAPDNLAASTPDPVVARLPRPRAAFMGQLDERLDQALLAALARARPDLQIVLAGRLKQGVDFDQLRALPNIHFLGYREYAALPGVLRDADVCLVPYLQSELTQSCNPLKVFEYLATGLPVVSSDLESLGDSRQVIAVATDHAGFIARVDEALTDGLADRDRRLAFAAANSWDSRVLELEQRLTEAVRRAEARSQLIAPAAAAEREPPEADVEASRSLKQRAFRATARAGGRVYAALRYAKHAAAGDPSHEPRSILVARRGRLGDLILAEPMLRALRLRFPRARLVLGVHGGAPADALYTDELVDEIRRIDYLSHGSLPGRVAGLLRIWLRGFDVVISGGRHFVMHEALLAGARRTIGLYDGDPLQLLNDAVLPLDPARHEADNNLALVESLGARLPQRERAPRLRLDLDEARRTGAAELERAGVRAARYAVVHPGAQKPSRRWPIERFAALCEGLLAGDDELHLLVSGAADERALFEQIMAGMESGVRGRMHDITGRTSLPGLAGILAGAALVVCNDTGVLHLARAAGAPLLALLGPENDARWGPYPLGAAPVIAIRHVVPCAPCSLWECAPLYCLRSLGQEEALQAARALLDGTAGGYQRRGAEWGWHDLQRAGHRVPLEAGLPIPPSLNMGAVHAGRER